MDCGAAGARSGVHAPDTALPANAGAFAVS
jgi:hypothetical protein